MKKSQQLKEKKRQLEEALHKKRVGNTALSPAFSSVAFRASTDMLSAIIVGTLLGFAFDKYLTTAHYGLIVGFILGAAAGLLTVYKRLCKLGYGFERIDSTRH